MPTTVIDLSRLLASEMWKPESFQRRASGATTAFKMRHVGELVAERREALDPCAYGDHLFWYVGLEQVAPHTGDARLAPCKGQEVLSRSKVFRDGDVLYGRLRPYLNKVFVATSPFDEGICSGEFFVLTPDQSQVLPVFLREILASRFVRDSIVGLNTGSALPRLQLTDLFRCMVPVPPLEYQKQVVAQVSALGAERRRAALLVEKQPHLLEAELSRALGEGTDFNLDRVSPSDPDPCEPCRLPSNYVVQDRRRRGGSLGFA